MPLKYHQATLDMLTKDPIDPEPHQEFLKRYGYIHEEEEGGPQYEPPQWTKLAPFQNEPQVLGTMVKAPASLREWYSLDIGLPAINVNDSWYVFDPKDWTLRGAPYRDYGYDDLPHNVLIFMREQQNGDWCIKLDEGDDPPVYWLDTHPLSLYQVAPRFSDFFIPICGIG